MPPASPPSAGEGKPPTAAAPPHRPSGQQTGTGAVHGSQLRGKELKSRARARASPLRSRAVTRQWKNPLKIAAKGPAGLSAVPGPGLSRRGAGGTALHQTQRLRGGAARPALQAAADTGPRSPCRGPRRRSRPGTCSLPSAPSRAGGSRPPVAPQGEGSGAEGRGGGRRLPRCRRNLGRVFPGPAGGRGRRGRERGRAGARAAASPAAARRPGAATPASPPPPCSRRPPPSPSPPPPPRPIDSGAPPLPAPIGPGAEGGAKPVPAIGWAGRRAAASAGRSRERAGFALRLRGR